MRARENFEVNLYFAKVSGGNFARDTKKHVGSKRVNKY
jgi:hypothetical protein